MASEETEIVNEETRQSERFAWAGPSLFVVVLVALVAFFWWFL
jgi:hypothetical protein